MEGCGERGGEGEEGGGGGGGGECSTRRFLTENVFLLVLLKFGGVRGQTIGSSPMHPQAPPAL